MLTYEQLLELAEQEARTSNKDVESVFGDIGLLLQKTLINWDYDFTPLNTLTFATTGGDGVHYGFLSLADGNCGSMPIVMTVPCCEENANIIVGESLYEFLCLGCYFGFFDLEQLAYNLEETIPLVEHPQPVDESQESLLVLLRQTLSLKPWRNVKSRLKQLNRQYMPALQMREVNWES